MRETTDSFSDVLNRSLGQLGFIFVKLYACIHICIGYSIVKLTTLQISIENKTKKKKKKCIVIH